MEINLLAIILMIIIFCLIGLYFIDRRVRRVLEQDNITIKLNDFTYISNIIKKISEIPDVMTAYIVKSNGADASPVYAEDYLVSVISAEGQNAEKIRKKYQSLIITSEYAKILGELSNKKELYFNINEVPDGLLIPDISLENIKEFKFFYLGTKRNCCCYCVITSSIIGSIVNNKSKINKHVKELRKIYKRNA